MRRLSILCLFKHDDGDNKEYNGDHSEGCKNMKTVKNTLKNMKITYLLPLLQAL